MFALVFWLFCTGVGYVLTGTLMGAITGAVIAMGISLLVSAILMSMR